MAHVGVSRQFRCYSIAFVAILVVGLLLLGCPAPDDAANSTAAAPSTTNTDAPVANTPDPLLAPDNAVDPNLSTPNPAGGDCCPPVGFEDPPPATGPDPEEVIAALLRLDSDGDHQTDFEELSDGTDPLDPTEADEDGDGILNRDDSDVDGDGKENAEDDDIDGDGESNGEDDDVDGDGLDASTDDDDDADGDPDETDNDDDGDGEPDCDCEHGRCSAFGGLCFCDAGWKGESCDEFHCRDLRDCLNGTCVGPNTCRCNQGWESAGRNVCNQFHCRDLRNCNGHGMCIGPATCECDQDWQGGLADCSIHSCDRNPAMCDDGMPCTIDECDPKTGCKHRDMTCEGFDVCVGGNCVTSCGNTSQCEDGQACRDGGCVDECERARDCNDHDPCTNDGCNSRMCVNTAISCMSPEVCKRGVCVAECSDDMDCDDEQKCNEGGCYDECDDGDCDMGERCEDDACVPVECEDDDDCGSGEACDDNGSCVPQDDF